VDGAGSSAAPCHTAAVVARFLPLAEVAEVLSVSVAQAYALVRSGELPAIKVGGRGQWRVETSQLEDYIARKYAETRAMVASRPSGEDTSADVADDLGG
jgi:excisionase family DNA binding protein